MNCRLLVRTPLLPRPRCTNTDTQKQRNLLFRWWSTATASALHANCPNTAVHWPAMASVVASRRCTDTRSTHCPERLKMRSTERKIWMMST